MYFFIGETLVLLQSRINLSKIVGCTKYTTAAYPTHLLNIFIISGSNGSSQPFFDNHSDCIIILQYIVQGPIQPSGSNRRAINDRIYRFLLFSPILKELSILNEKTSFFGIHIIPKVRLKLSLSKST